MENLQAILLFAVGLLLLIKAGDWFVDGATGLARRFHIPDILIGATVVSIGTTLPGLVKGRLYRWQGILLLAIYAAFCTFQFLL